MSAAQPAREKRIVRAPRVLFFVAVAVLVAGLVVQWRGGAGAGRAAAIAMIAAYLGWMLLEVPVTFRRAASVRDSRTLIPYALARIATIAASVLVPAPARSLLAVAASAALFAGGVAVREIAIRTLGRFYSHHVARRADQVAVTSGPYRLVRHPAYCGMLLAHAGLVGLFFRPASAACLALLVAAVVWRIRVEERALWDMPGYAEYAAGRMRLFPGVW